MYHSVTSSCIRQIKAGTAPRTFGGSSSFRANTASEIVRVRRDSRTSRPSVADASLVASAADAASALESPPAPPSHRLNKPKIRAKINAFFNLQATREFCAFFTITFPSGIREDDAYTLFNLWQTRCRKAFNLTSFVWVAERQRNGTVHFHLLTNTRMPIRVINNYMAVALLPYAHRYGWDIAKIQKYNGIDVDNVWYPKRPKNQGSSQRRTRDDAARHLGRYITKYVSKNNETFARLAWHESHDIAALFTCQNYDIEEITPLLTYFRSTRNLWRKYENEFVAVYLHPTVYNLTPYTDLARVNECVYAQCQ